MWVFSLIELINIDYCARTVDLNPLSWLQLCHRTLFSAIISSLRPDFYLSRTFWVLTKSHKWISWLRLLKILPISPRSGQLRCRGLFWWRTTVSVLCNTLLFKETLDIEGPEPTCWQGRIKSLSRLKLPERLFYSPGVMILKHRSARSIYM